MPLARAIRSAVQWVVSVGGSANVSATTRSATSGPPGNPRGARLVSQEAVDALFHEPLLPAPDAGLRRAGLAHDLVGPDTVGAQKHNVCSPNVLLRGVTVFGDRFKPMAIWSCDLDGNP